MRNLLNIRLISLSLLLIYLFINTPFVLLHHHHFLTKGQTSLGFVAYSEDNLQFSAVKKSCFLCDQHFISEHTPGFFSFVPREINEISEAPCRVIHFHTDASAIVCLNKDPPKNI